MDKPKLITATFQVVYNNVGYTIEFGQSSVTISNHDWKAILRKPYPPTLLSCQKLIEKLNAQRSMSEGRLKIFRGGTFREESANERH